MPSMRTQYQDERSVGLCELADDGHYQLLHLLGLQGKGKAQEHAG